MMTFDEIVMNFAISVGAGLATNLIENSSLDSRINDCFKRALDNWEVSQVTRDSMKNKPLVYYTDLKNYIVNPERGINPKIKELLKLWVKELNNDSLCYNFIIEHKQDVIISKSNEALVILKNELLPKLDKISEKQDEIGFDVKTILSQLTNLQGRSNISNQLLHIIIEPVAYLIDQLKLHSARLIISELKSHFMSDIENDQILKSEFLYREGQTLLFIDNEKSSQLFHEAFLLNSNKMDLIKIEIKRLVSIRDIASAKELAFSSGNAEILQFVNVINSESPADTFRNIPKEISNDYSFRQDILVSLLSKEFYDIAFLFEDCNIKTQEKLTYSNINDWMFIFSFLCSRICCYVFFVFDKPQINEICEKLPLVNSFFEKLSKTEVENEFPAIKMWYCYWNYVCTKDSVWLSEFDKIDKSSVHPQHRRDLRLIELSMLALSKRNEEVVVTLLSSDEFLDLEFFKAVFQLSICTNNIDACKWILDKCVQLSFLINSELSVFIAQTITPYWVKLYKNYIEKLKFDVEEERILLLQICRFVEGETVDIRLLKNISLSLNDELKAFAANMLAYNGDEQLAFEMLSSVVDENTHDIKQRLFISVLMLMQEKKPQLYKILVNNRRSGSFCDDELLKCEFNLAIKLADYENAYASIKELYNRHQDDISLFVNYVFVVGHYDPDLLSEFESKALTLQDLDTNKVVLVYKSFAENSYLNTACDFLYKQTKISEDYELRTFYYEQASFGLIKSVVSVKQDLVEDKNWVLCDVEGELRYYLADSSKINICSALVGKKIKEQFSYEVDYEIKRITVLDILNKYQKLASDIIKQSGDGSNPQITPFKIDMDHPLKSIEDFLRKHSKDNMTPLERQRISYDKYKKGDLAIFQLINESHVIPDYYKFLFSPFEIHTSISNVEIQHIKMTPGEYHYVLDLPTILLFSEFESKYNLSILGSKTVTTVVLDFIKSSCKNEENNFSQEMYEALSTGVLKQMTDNINIVEVKTHLNNIKCWTEENCDIIVAENALAINEVAETTWFIHQLFSSLSLLQNDTYIMVTDDVNIKRMYPAIRTISSESFVKLFNSEEIIITYSNFLFECGFVGVDIEVDFIKREYIKMRSNKENKLSKIMHCIQFNPMLLSKVITSCIQLVSNEIDINTLKITFTNMMALALKGYPIENRDFIVQLAAKELNIPSQQFQLSRQCLLDAKLIVDSSMS